MKPIHPPITPPQKTWIYRTWIFLVTAFLIFAHVRLYPYAFDDAFIHFRIVRHLWENGVPYYNLNEMVKVSTSSGWVIFLTPLYGLASTLNLEKNFPLFIALINTAITLTEILLYTKITEKILGIPLSLPVKLLFQLSFLALILPPSFGLMETPLALLLAGLGIYLLLQTRALGFTLLGIAIYFRLEIAVLLGLIGLIFLLKKQFSLPKIIGYSALGILPFVCYDLYFFHTIVPNSVIAKPTVYSIPYLNTLLNIMVYSLPEIPSDQSFIQGFLAVLFSSTLTITGLETFKQWRKNRAIWTALFFTFGLLIIEGYIMGRALIFEWYEPLYMIPILIATLLCLVSMDPAKNLILKGLFYLLSLISFVWLGIVFYAGTYDPGQLKTYFEYGSRVRAYLTVGTILYEEYPNATLLTSEIGGLGYAFQGKVVDGVGLATPGALAFHPMHVPEERISGMVGAIPPGYVHLIKPEIIVSYDIFCEALRRDPLLEEYNEIILPAYLPAEAQYAKKETIMGSKYLRIYIRKDLPLTERLTALADN